MRITNRMMTNNMLMNINRNQNQLNDYDMQISTGKRIQRPSDDPIVAVRALRFRTTVSEVKQYTRNCDDAKSWCEVSEQAASNVIDICKRVRDLSVQSASDLLNVGNRKKIIAEFKELKEQFLNEANASYAGRYIFSGFKTSTAAAFTEQDIKDMKTKETKYTIKQYFSKDDIKKKEVVKGTGDAARITEVNRIRLGYSKIKIDQTATPKIGIDTNAPAPVTVVYADSSDPDAYVTADNQIKVLADTGELIINDKSKDVIDAMTVPFEVTYEKHDFEKLDLKPECYFECTKKSKGAGGGTETENFAAKQGDMNYQISYSQMLTVNSPAEDIVPVDLQRDMEEIIREVESIKESDSLDSKLKADILGKRFSSLLGKADKHIDKLLDTRADIGGKINRLTLTKNRLADDTLNFTEIMSKNEDIDYAKTYTNMSSMLSVYKASLQATSQVIKPSLLDFLR